MTYYRNPASWETIFSKSSENVDEVELNCCRRIVQLCKDCLLIVYQFAAEAKNASQVGERENEGTVTQRYLKGIIVIVKE
jgi:tubulin polyglutamylase TTLL7